MGFSSSLGKKIDTCVNWAGVVVCLTLIVLTTAAWTPKKATAGKPAPEFALAGLASEDSVRLSGLRGKVVFMDFWASWCIPCRQLMPRIAALKAANPELEVVAISVDANREKAITFLRAVEPSLRAVHDGSQKVADSYGVERMPSSFLIDREGRLRFRHDGYSAKELDAIERQVRLLLEE